MTLFIIVMGVSGSGKTTVGKLLAHELGWVFHDGDDYHSARNVSKMRDGIPLTDEDRAAWLRTLASLISESLDHATPGVLACSALKQRYRDLLRVDRERVRFVYLKGSAALISARMHERAGHFMPPELLQSQLELLEEPENALTVDIQLSPDEIVACIIDRLQLQNN